MLQKIVMNIDETPLTEICSGVPSDFLRLLSKCRETTCDEKPDYNYFLRALNKIMVRKSFKNDGVYDWNKVNYLAIDKESKLKEL